MTHIRAVVMGIVEAAIVVAVLEGAHFFGVSPVGNLGFVIVIIAGAYILAQDFISRRTQLALPYRLTTTLTVVVLIALWGWLASVEFWLWLMFVILSVRRLLRRATPSGTQVTR